MIDVCDYFNLHATTTHGAIAYLDRLQPNDKFTRFEWQMLAICCILISSKYNECEEHVPDFETLGDITQQRIVNEVVLSYELYALRRMGWKLNVSRSCSVVVVGSGSVVVVGSCSVVVVGSGSGSVVVVCGGDMNLVIVIYIVIHEG